MNFIEKDYYDISDNVAFLRALHFKKTTLGMVLITSGVGRVIVSWLDAAPMLTDAASCHLFLLPIPTSHNRGANYSDDFTGECGGCAND